MDLDDNDDLIEVDQLDINLDMEEETLQDLETDASMDILNINLGLGYDFIQKG